MANLGYSIPMFEVNEEGEWTSNTPSVVTTTTVLTPTTPTTTTTAVPAPVMSPVETSVQISVETSSTWIERWFQAEWDDFPFENTIKLLEERYPPNTPNKYHFRLSTAVEFLREGGKLKGLDNVWNGE